LLCKRRKHVAHGLEPLNAPLWPRIEVEPRHVVCTDVDESEWLLLRLLVEGAPFKGGHFLSSVHSWRIRLTPAEEQHRQDCCEDC
jgi:hypothetical protein